MGRARGVTVAVGVSTASRRPRGWTEDGLERALRAFVGGRDTWPTSEDFVNAGRSDLREAVKRRGGARVWAEKLGKNLGPGQDRSAYDVEDAVAEALRVIEDRGALPGMRVLRAEGHTRLASFIQTRGGGSVGAFVSAHMPVGA